MDGDLPPAETPANFVPAPAAPDVSAGFWLRGGAYMTDGVLIAVPSYFISLALPDPGGLAARVLLAASYFTVLPPLMNGQTFGKKAAGVAIVRIDGSPLTHGRAFGRWLGYLLSALPLFLGFACAAFTPQKRALHDYAAGTRVIRIQELGLGRKALLALPILTALALSVLEALSGR
jgi:uncharacterized RDD family membrane protein YckC